MFHTNLLLLLFTEEPHLLTEEPYLLTEDLFLYSEYRGKNVVGVCELNCYKN